MNKNKNRMLPCLTYLIRCQKLRFFPWIFQLSQGRCCPPLRNACSCPPMLFPLLSFPGALMNNHWGWTTSPLPSRCLGPSLPGPLMDIIRPADQLHAVCDNGTTVLSVSRWPQLSPPVWWTIVHLQGQHAAFFCYCCGSPSLSWAPTDSMSVDVARARGVRQRLLHLGGDCHLVKKYRQLCCFQQYYCFLKRNKM